MARHPVCPDIERLRRAHHAEGNGVDWSNQVRMKVPRAPTRADRRWAVGVALLLVVSACGPSGASVSPPSLSPDPTPAPTDVALGLCEEPKSAIALFKAEHAALPVAGDDARTLRAAIQSIGRLAPQASDLGQQSPLPEIVMALQLDLVPRPARIDVQIDGSFLAH